jgi:methylmalonyl-CoA/ethylmalonyl-CoA epimerase
MVDDIRVYLGNPTLHHVGIVSTSEDQALSQIASLGLVEDFRGYVERWQVLCIFTTPNGATPLEFLVPESGPLQSFNRGLGGLHHVAFRVPNLTRAMRGLAKQGIPMLESEPIKGAGNFLCNFLHPAYTKSFTVELVEELKGSLL